jgi:hypothetical protein
MKYNLKLVFLASFLFLSFINFHLRDFFLWFTFLGFFPITLQSYFRVYSKENIEQLLGGFSTWNYISCLLHFSLFFSHYHLWEVLWFSHVPLTSFFSLLVFSWFFFIWVYHFFSFLFVIVFFILFFILKNYYLFISKGFFLVFHGFFWQWYVLTWGISISPHQVMTRKCFEGYTCSIRLCLHLQLWVLIDWNYST